MTKQILLLPLLASCLSSCQTQSQVYRDSVFDIRKACSESPRFVRKIMAFRHDNFKVSQDDDPILGSEETWDMKTSVAKRHDMKWFQVKFIDGKMKSLWFGPRSHLEKDLKLLGMIPYELLDKKGERVDVYDLGTYKAIDFSDREFEIDYDSPHSEGVTVTCF